MNMNFTGEIYNKVLIIIEDLCLEIINQVLNQLGMLTLHQFAIALFDVEWFREQNYDMGDLL